MKPPQELIEECRIRLSEIRAEAAKQNVSDLAESMFVEIILCGRIWSNTVNEEEATKIQLVFEEAKAALVAIEQTGTAEEVANARAVIETAEAALGVAKEEEFTNASLTNHSGALQSHLRACLAFHLLKRLEDYDWENVDMFHRNEHISNNAALRNNLGGGLISRGITEEEKHTLEVLGIDIPSDILDSDGNLITTGVVMEPDRRGIPYTPASFWKDRDLFHISLSKIQDVINTNVRHYDLDRTDATAYFSLTITRIFDKAVLSIVADPGALKRGNDGVGLLHRVEEHALISAPIEEGEPTPHNGNGVCCCYCCNILELLGERLSREAQEKGMNLEGLSLKCSKALKGDYPDADAIPRIILPRSPAGNISPEDLGLNMDELQEKEEQINLGWKGFDSQDRGENTIYIDAVQLSTQIWGELGDRTSMKAFLRSIRITPYMNFVFGQAIGSVKSHNKILHGGDDFFITYDAHSVDKDDLVPELMVGEMEPLIGDGRWHYDETKETWHVIGKGFARPFWWWYDGPSFDKDKDSRAIMEALKTAKHERRVWLECASRTDVQIHPKMD